MRWLKDRIPKSWRLAAQLQRRRWRDQQQGLQQQFADAAPLPALPYSIHEAQPIRPSKYFRNKVHNLQLGAERINKVLMLPGQIFSYWNIIGAPNADNGFREGRNLINGQLQADYGGGLCQLSGIIYLLGLRSGLEVLERHHHSVDIYTEEKRFCPLGADATVVYGYKDLRLRNPYSFAIAFEIQIMEQEVQAQLKGEQALADLSLAFRREVNKSGTLVRTLRLESGVQKELIQSYYRKLNH